MNIETNDYTLKQITIETDFKSIVSVSLVENATYSDVYLHEIDKLETLNGLLVQIHRHVDGLETCIWTDHDYDEPSTVKYLALGNREIRDVTELGALVEAIHQAKRDEVILYELVFEAYI